MKFIIHVCAIYINPIITVYLINVGLGGLGEDGAFVLAFITSCWVAKV